MAHPIPGSEPPRVPWSRPCHSVDPQGVAEAQGVVKRGTKGVVSWGAWIWLWLGLVLVVSGCATGRREPVRAAAFDPVRDTVGFTNETRWIYVERPGGGMAGQSREKTPEYSLRCFVVARLNRQFFDHARFAPEAAAVGDRELRRRIREVVARSKRRPSALDPGARVEIPGYRDLRELSEARGEWLKADGGRAVESYTQRGHWRMLLPFSRRHQARVAEELASGVAAGRPRVMHLVRFPQLSINHAVLVYGARATSSGWEFEAADPNAPGQPVVLGYRRAAREFHWPRVPYFPGGKVHVYEVYRNTWY